MTDRILKTDCSNPDFIHLTERLDADIITRESDSNSFFGQFNKVDDIKFAVVAYKNGKPVACGAIKEYNNTAMEIKRMFVLSSNRGSGLASSILSELEEWAIDLGYNECVLQTTEKHHEAISLYVKYGYTQIPSYGQYKEGDEDSMCFRKSLSK